MAGVGTAQTPGWLCEEQPAVPQAHGENSPHSWTQEIANTK